MIKSFKCRLTYSLYKRNYIRKFDAIAHIARKKLVMLEAAETIRDLRSPPSNRLEKLKGDRDGQYSIRINKQWRICFKWETGCATEVEIVDYH